MAGHLEWRPTPPGKYGRHYVDGLEVHCGDLLELELDDGAWVVGRYEWNPAAGMEPTLNHGEGVVLLTESSRLRWPEPALAR